MAAHHALTPAETRPPSGNEGDVLTVECTVLGIPYGMDSAIGVLEPFDGGLRYCGWAA